MINEVSELVWVAFGQPIMGVVPSATATVAAGSVNWNERVIIVFKDLAAFVVAADARVAEGA